MNPPRSLLEGECGQPNALVRVGRQLFEDANSAKAHRVLGPFQPTTRPEDELAKEFLAEFGGVNQRAPSTFSMHGLLDEVNRLEEVGHSGFLRPLSNNSRNYDQPSQEWAQEFLLNEGAAGGHDSLLDAAWHGAVAEPMALKWSVDYLTDAENAIGSGLNAVASPSMMNEKFSEVDAWNNEYMQYVDKLDRDVALVDGSSDQAAGTSATENDLLNSESYWQKMESEWDNMAKNFDTHSWLSEYEDLSSIYKTYNMADENPYVQTDDPLALGKQYLSGGHLAKAVLCFEAAVQRQPESAESWLYLSRAQGENEQEARAIAAASKCLELEPDNLNALEILSTAYANESLYDSSCKTLAQWLGAHPKYKHLAPANVIDGKRGLLISSFMDQGLFKEVETALLNAARSDETVDPELQNSLGILYNLCGNTERAVDCFQTAIMVRPHDPRLWNRLGATLANGGRSAEAVSSYRKALELYPGFVRARYNLGISCLNLGASREAIDHFLSALTLQMTGVGPADKGVMSDSIWGTLRVAVSGLRRDDLLNYVDRRNLVKLKELFNSAPSDWSGGPEVTAPVDHMSQ